ncbi:MAG: Gfo/Idh/MocA family oxidoreductase [Planctomycetes bacterium]|nr:Gfo/Idh/MocA family oxidoreductase [Planctomycetota bacterium]
MGKAHANAFGQAPRFFDLNLRPSLEAVAARDQASLADFATRWGIGRRHARWQDLVADPEIDLVDVASPNDCHAEQAIAALEAGKHVVCEKPLAATWPEALAMARAARRAPGRTFVWFNYRRCPAVAEARALVRAGRLGAIRHVRASYLQSWGGPETPMSWRFDRARAGSGAHGDLNAHAVDLCRFLTGEEIVTVAGALSRTFVTERNLAEGGRARADVDDALLFIAGLSGGGTASFEASRVAPGHLNRNRIELNGELGSLRWDFEDMNVLEVCLGDGGWTRVMCTSAGRQPWVAAWWPDAHVLGYEHGFVNQVADMMRVLAGEEPEAPLADFADACRTQAVLEAALRAAAEARPVALAEFETP